MRKFKVSEESLNGTSLMRYITLSYSHLVKKLGPPNSHGDGYKVSTQWILEDNKGNVFSIYDYKETSLYSSNYPSVEEFRALPEYEWHIGARGMEGVNDLIDWLVK